MKWKILIAAATALLLYNSVYFEKLSLRESAEQQLQLFDAVTYARDFWDNRLPPVLSSAVDVRILLPLLQNDMSRAVAQFGKKLGIGSNSYYLVRGEGLLRSISEQQIMLQATPGVQEPDIAIQTDFIFGNAIRDASGLVEAGQFVNTMEFNSVSSEINKIVRKEVLPGFLNSIYEDARVRFVGAIEVDTESNKITPLNVIPVRLEIIEQ